MARPENAGIRNELMADHVPYKIAMMRATHDGLRAGIVPLGTCSNAIIGSFAVHARSLIYFFNGKKGSRAADFTENYQPFDSGPVSPRLFDKLSNQIAHITEKRFDAPEDKLNGDDIQALRLLLDAEIVRFLDHMQARYRNIWDTKMKHLRPWS